MRCQSEDPAAIAAAFSTLVKPVVELHKYETLRLQSLSLYMLDDLQLTFNSEDFLGDYQSLQIRWRLEPA